MTSRLLDTLGTADAFADATRDRSLLAAMLQFEVALARAEARLGVIPADGRGRNRRVRRCERIRYRGDRRRGEDLGHASRLASLRHSRPGFESGMRRGAGYVHWGATSQDVTDTRAGAVPRQARPLLERHHGRLVKALRKLADTTLTRVMLGRTLLAAGAAGHLRAEGRRMVRRMLARMGPRAAGFYRRDGSPVRGGVGNTSRLLKVAASRSRWSSGGSFGPTVPDAPWHAHRDRLAALMAACAVYVGALGKIATDISLLMQAEVGEAAEAGGEIVDDAAEAEPGGLRRGLAAATRVPGLLASFLSGMAQQHERGVGGGHAEGPTVSALIQATGAALAALEQVADSLRVDPARMRTNIDGDRRSRVRRACDDAARAFRRVATPRTTSIREAATRAAADGRAFVDALAAIPQVRDTLTAAELSSLADPDHVSRRRGAAAADASRRLITRPVHPCLCSRCQASRVLPARRTRRFAGTGVVAFARPGSRHVGRAGIRSVRALPGAQIRHSRSWRERRDARRLRVEQLARDLVALLDALGIDRVALCGLSLGGMIGMWLAEHAPER